MKKIFSIFFISLLFASTFVFAGPSTSINLITGPNPIYQEGNFPPLIFLNENGCRALYNEPNWILPGVNGDLLQRDNNYIFTGEQIQWTVLVWDKNGVPEKIEDVFAGWVTQTNGPLDPDMQVNCNYEGEVTGNLAQQGYSNVRRPGDQEPQINGNPDTMGEYSCLLTVEPSCHGQKW